MNKYIYNGMVYAGALIAICVVITVAINVVIQGIVSSGTFFNALGALFTGLLQ